MQPRWSVSKLVNAASAVKNELIGDLIFMSMTNNIPMESIAALRPFFSKWIRCGGSIPAATQLRTYVPNVAKTIRNEVRDLFKSTHHTSRRVPPAPNATDHRRAILSLVRRRLRVD